jgi:hypothetical protein
MKNKQKAWRESSRRNTIEGKLTGRQFIAARRHNPVPSKLLRGLLHDKVWGL